MATILPVCYAACSDLMRRRGVKDQEKQQQQKQVRRLRLFSYPRAGCQLIKGGKSREHSARLILDADGVPAEEARFEQQRR